MLRPLSKPDWATNANYPVILDPVTGLPVPWSSQPNKVQPSAGQVAQGQTPNTGIPSEIYNFMLNNHGLWADGHDKIIVGSAFHLTDDFVNPTGGSPAPDSNKWALSSVGGAPVIFDDSAADGFGVCRLNPAGGASSVNSCNLPVGSARDFYFSTRVRVLNIAGIGLIDIGLFTNTDAVMIDIEPNANWFNLKTNGTITPFLVGQPGGYHFIEVLRIGGEVYAWFDGTLQAGPIANTSFGAVVPHFTMTANAPGGGDSAQIMIDSVKLAIDR